VLCFLILGSSRSEPLQFWWGPMSPALVIALGVIVTGALVILSRVHVLAAASLFWVTFASGLGILAASGHLGPVANGYFWRVLVTSPEVFIFLSFMITDPKTVPETRTGRRIYAISIGLLSVLLIAPERTEFAAKVGLLGTLTIVCAARPLIILGREALARRRAAGTLPLSHLPRLGRPALVAATSLGAVCFAGLLVVAGSPARSLPSIPSLAMGAGASVPVSIAPTAGVSAIDRPTGNRVAADAIQDLRLAAQALNRRNAGDAAAAASGNYLADLRTQIERAAGHAIVVPSYDVSRVGLKLRPAVGQAPPTVVATLTGIVTQLTYATASSTTPQRGARSSFTRTFDLALSGNRFVIIGDGSLKTTTQPAGSSLVTSTQLSKRTPGFAAVQLTDVAAKVGLNFRQGAFRYGMSDDPQAMMARRGVLDRLQQRRVARPLRRRLLR
jgi:hypothetical protein